MTIDDVECCEASWDINLDVNCPHCGYGFDVTDYITVCDLPECGQSKKNCNIEIDCPNCSEHLRITELMS